jgi:type IV pilus assembly protein PilQ
VQEVRIVGFDLSSGQLARVEILLKKTTEYQVSLDGKEFRVAFTADDVATKSPTTEVAAKEDSTIKPVPVAVQSASVDASKDADVLRNVTLSAGRAILESNGKIGKYQYFALNNPPRLIVDVYGMRPGFKERSFAAEAGFKKVRVGTHNNKTRLVFDASKNTLPEHLVEGRATDILVTWGDVKTASDVKPAPVVDEKPVAKAAPGKAMRVANVEAIDFTNEEGRSVIVVELSEAAKVLSPVKEGNLVRFEVVNSSISRALRRTIDASAFPSAVTSVTPYTVKDGDHQNVRIAVELKGPVAYALEQDGATVRLVVDDGAYAEPTHPAVSQVEIVAPVATQDVDVVEKQTFAPTRTPVTADEMAVEAAKYTGEKITLVFDSANVRSILQLIGEVSGLNILASSDVKGSVTLRLIDVPWDQALDLVLETADLGKVQQGNVLRIMPKSKIAELDQAAMKQQMLAIEEGVLETKLFPISYASVDDMKGYLSDIKSDRGSIIADSRNKQLIVRDVAAVLVQMQEMINYIDQPERQVMIEARIVEANTNFSRDMGVKWSTDYDNNGNPKSDTLSLDSMQTGMGGSFFIPTTNPASAGFATAMTIGSLTNDFTLDLHLSALENSGEGKIISTPRVTTLNGEKAIISQGTKIPFSSVSDQGTDVQFENAELKLEVTPEINPDGSIILDINVSNSAVGIVVPTATGNAVSIDEKKAETKVLVKDGQTTVIGGIFIEDERDAETGVPILMSIPYLGRLFKSTTKTRDRRELLIFITPRIVTP